MIQSLISDLASHATAVHGSKCTPILNPEAKTPLAAFEGQIGQVAYSATKAALVGMTLPVARELAKLGIRCITIAPGIFMTPMLAGLSQDVQDALGKQVPSPPRLGRPDEFAPMVPSS